MSLNRGPTDETDRRPDMVCSGCKKLLPCYRGARISVVETPKGSFERFAWWCRGCLRGKIAEALAHSH